MIKIDLKSVLLFCCIICCAFFVVKSCQEEKKNKQMINDIDCLTKQRDSLIFYLNESNETILQLKDSISSIEGKVVYIKQTIYEKVDSVFNLPVDSALEYFTEQISLQANSKQ